MGNGPDAGYINSLDPATTLWYGSIIAVDSMTKMTHGSTITVGLLVIKQTRSFDPRGSPSNKTDTEL